MKKQIKRGRLGVLVISMTVLAAASMAGLSSPMAAPDKEESSLVDINTASTAELVSVPGIGEALAQRIVEFREKNGPFETVDDLLKVRGIGERSLAKFRHLLMASKPKK